MLEQPELISEESIEKAKNIADQTYRALETRTLLNIPGLDRHDLGELMLDKVQPGKAEDNFAAVLSALAHEIISDFVLERHLEDDQEEAIKAVEESAEMLSQKMLAEIEYFPAKSPEDRKIKVKGVLF